MKKTIPPKNLAKILGSLLKEARVKKNLSQGDVAQFLKLNSAQSISDWERNYGSGVPVPSLKQLAKLYGMKLDQVFEALLESQVQKLEKALTAEFYKKSTVAKRR